MRKLSILGLSAGTALLCAIPVSLQLSQDTLSVSIDRASARVGRPLTPVSVAGVHRRVERRAIRRAYYGGDGYGGYWNGAGLGYGVAAAGVAAGVAAASTPYYYGNSGYWNDPGYTYGGTIGGVPAREAAAS